MSNDAQFICDSTSNSIEHDFIVIDWLYQGQAPNLHPHTKQARRLLCQKCFVEYDLGMIARARKSLLSSEAA
jgi:hypothetical protein